MYDICFSLVYVYELFIRWLHKLGFKPLLSLVVEYVKCCSYAANSTPDLVSHLV
jgi:hypothetical protein